MTTCDTPPCFSLGSLRCLFADCSTQRDQWCGRGCLRLISCSMKRTLLNLAAALTSAAEAFGKLASACRTYVHSSRHMEQGGISQSLTREFLKRIRQQEFNRIRSTPALSRMAYSSHNGEHNVKRHSYKSRYKRTNRS